MGVAPQDPYQCATVGVATEANRLFISDLGTGERIAEHLIRLEKGQIIKNTHHYRDLQQRLAQLEAELSQQLGSAAVPLCALLKATSPKIYKDQLAGARQVIAAHLQRYGSIEPELLNRIVTASRLTATQLRDTLQAYHQHPERLSPKNKVDAKHPVKATNALAHYASLNGHSTGQGVSHVYH